MEIEVIYHSVAEAGLGEADIYDLVKKAQEHNKQKNITGCLLYYKGEFIQALEGENDIIDELLNKISEDNRHSEMHIIYKGPCNKRNYAEWSMAYDSLNDSDIQKLESAIDMEGFAALHTLKNSPSKVKKIFAYLSEELKNE